MIDIKINNDIQIPRGDTGKILINLLGEIAPESTALFTVRYNELTPSIISKQIKIIDKTVEVRLTSQDTQVPPGQYLWDLRILQGDQVDTPILGAKFIVERTMGNVD